MQYRIIYKKFSGSWVLVSLMAMASTVVADNKVMQPRADYSMQYVAEAVNPWLLPEQREGKQNFKKFPEYQGQQNYTNKTDRQVQGYRFVTPEILESLHQQQKQSQLLQDDSQKPQYRPRQPGPGYYGSPPYPNQFYDTPAIAPWGSGSDSLYQGGSLPWVPSEAIGGISPITPMYHYGESGSIVDSNTEKQKQNNVFNPYTFIRDENF